MLNSSISSIAQLLKLARPNPNEKSPGFPGLLVDNLDLKLVKSTLGWNKRVRVLREKRLSDFPDRARLLYAIGNNVPIDLATYIFRAICCAAFPTSMPDSLPFPSLITCFTMASRVPVEPTDKLYSPWSPLDNMWIFVYSFTPSSPPVKHPQTVVSHTLFFSRSVKSVGSHSVLTFNLSSNKGFSVQTKGEIGSEGEIGEEGLSESSSYANKDADEVVTFKFCHGGKLVKNTKDSQWSYLGGEVSWFDYCEVDYMSMLELFGMAKDLGYDDGYDVSFYGEEFGTSRLIHIISDSTLLACMSMVPKSNGRLIVLYLKVVSLTSSQVGNDNSDQEYSCFADDDSSDPDFEDSDYAQSDEEIDLLKNDDKWFKGYVDHSCIDNDPNAQENDESDNGEESPTLTCPIALQVKMMQKAVRIYSINCGRELIFMNNDRNKIRAACEEGCPFVIHALSVSGTTYLQIFRELRLNPNWTASSFAEQVHQDYGYRPSRATVNKARAMAVDIVEGSYSKQYEVLWDYCHELRTRNVGTCKNGFLDGCRPVVCLDGCHVKGPRPGQVLSAMGVDANNGMFPLTYAYVEIKSNSTWLRGLALKHQMEAIAKATTVPWFHMEMRKILELSKPAHDWRA
ncbi:unnamed protein product [Prunus armeniaca]